MSPASQGALEVERYIGSCLISSNVRPGAHKTVINKKQEPVLRGKTRGCYGVGQSYGNGGVEQCQVQYGPSGWAGAPLISMTSSPRRCNQRSSPLLGQQQQQQQQQQPQQQQQQQVCEQQMSGHLHKSPLSRLAIHTQGAPLILAGRFHNRGKVHSGGNVNGIAGNPVCGNNPAVNNGYAQGNGNNGTTTMTTTTTTVNGTIGNGGPRCQPSRPQRPAEPAKKQQTNTKPECTGNKDTAGTNIANIDSLSIASDESSGSNNSENSLPRIIKPRKRRKKDRKPLNNVATTVDGKHEEQQQQQPVHTVEQQSNVANLKPYMAGCYEHRYEVGPPPPHLRNHRRPPIGRESVYGSKPQLASCSPMQEIADVRQRYAHHRHVEVKVLDGNRNIVPAPVRVIPAKGYRNHPHHISNNNNNMPRYLHEYADPPGCEGIKDGLGLCQCRYCDPSGLIWDVDQNCYSPFLTPSSATGEFCPSHFGQIPLFLSRPTGLAGCQEQQQQQTAVERLFDVDNTRLHNERENGNNGVVLRRSWSDPTSYFSEEIAAPSKDVGVIGDRGQTESGKRRTLWRGDTIGIPTGNHLNSVGAGANGVAASPKGLEVSTEIITSPNGHRDLEIKFYSPSPNAPAPEEDKAVLPEEADEEEEDFSDIWSYHESKLQQDFRTLLQAEE